MAVYQFRGTSTLLAAPQCGCTTLYYKEDIGAFECIAHSNLFELQKADQEDIIEVLHEQVVTDLYSMKE